MPKIKKEEKEQVLVKGFIDDTQRVFVVENYEECKEAGIITSELEEYKK